MKDIKRPALRYGTAILAATITLSIFSMSAASHDTPQTDSIQKLPPTAATSCNALLNNQPQTQSTATVDPQRTAGKLVTISYLLGTRFALGPQKTSQTDAISVEKRSTAKAEKGDRSALAIAAYRLCIKEKTLEHYAQLTRSEKG